MELILNKKRYVSSIIKKPVLKRLDRTVYVNIKRSTGQCQFDITNVNINSKQQEAACNTREDTALKCHKGTRSQATDERLLHAIQEEIQSQ